MPKAIDPEYARLKAFLAFYADRYFNLETLPPEQRLVACLELLEKKGIATARRGLRMAINDCIEASSSFGRVEVERLDAELRGLGIVTLSELRMRYSKDYARIKKREQIGNETEYYLVRNVLEDPTEKTSDERRLLEEMISEYEGRVVTAARK
jgi:hypothetical protein